MREALRRQHMFSHAGVARPIKQKRLRKMQRASQRDLTMRRMSTIIEATPSPMGRRDQRRGSTPARIRTSS